MTYDDAEDFIRELQGLLKKWDAELSIDHGDLYSKATMYATFKNIAICLDDSISSDIRKVDIRVWA